MVHRKIAVLEDMVVRKKSLERLLQESYKKATKEDAFLVKDWDATTGDGID